MPLIRVTAMKLSRRKGFTRPLTQAVLTFASKTEPIIMKKITLTFLALLMMIFGVFYDSALAQCGADGTQPCPPKTLKPPVVDSTAKQRAAKENAERDKAERQRIARERVKQAAKQKANAGSEAVKTVAAYAAAMKKAKPLKLFPVEGVTFGETGSKYLSLAGNKCDVDDADSSGCYELNGIYFYCDENDLTDKLYISSLRLDGMPEDWKKLGFDWDLSYNEWVNLFKQKGYASLATENPKVVTKSGKQYLKAELTTVVKIANGYTRLTFNFVNGYGKTSVNDKGTLFSIVADKLN